VAFGMATKYQINQRASGMSRTEYENSSHVSLYYGAATGIGAPVQ
jgi:hypothetical protein